MMYSLILWVVFFSQEDQNLYPLLLLLQVYQRRQDLNKTPYEINLTATVMLTFLRC